MDNLDLGLTDDDRAAAHARTFEDFVAIVRRLRRDCPWDRVQTNDSVKHLTIEETYELVDAIDEGDTDEIKKELGDLFLHVLFHTHIAETEGHFTLQDVMEAEMAKLVRRHPHVFGQTVVNSTGEVVKTWEAIKQAERAAEAKQTGGKPARQSVLDGVPEALPALLRAERVQEKVAAVGFDFPEASGAWAKVEEEIGELKALDAKDPAALEDEFGDVLFALVNYGRFIGVAPENALRATVRKFSRRFRHIEARLSEGGQTLQDASLEEMDRHWEEAKALEAQRGQ
ncbi:MAG: nucleoside triphosphate pyrophosphohydrolase [Bacteroidota bacterium]